MKYSVCTDAVFKSEADICKAMTGVKECGYSAYEFWSWWDRDMEKMVSTQAELGLDCAAFCAKFIEPGDERNHEEYEKSLKQAIENAKSLNCKTLIAQAGWVMDNIPYTLHRKNVKNLFRRVAPLAEREGVTLVIEPLNRLVDHPLAHLYSSRDAFSLIEQIGSPNIKLLFDIYHQQITEGNLIANITENIEKIGHFHAAGNPGRGEITKGEICYRHVFEAISATGYEGYVGIEYMTDKDPRQGLMEAREILAP